MSPEEIAGKIMAASDPTRMIFVEAIPADLIQPVADILKISAEEFGPCFTAEFAELVRRRHLPQSDSDRVDSYSMRNPVKHAGAVIVNARLNDPTETYAPRDVFFAYAVMKATRTEAAFHDKQAFHAIYIAEPTVLLGFNRRQLPAIGEDGTPCKTDEPFNLTEKYTGLDVKFVYMRDGQMFSAGVSLAEIDDAKRMHAEHGTRLETLIE